MTQVMQRAEGIAVEHGHTYLGTEHVMLALIEDDGGIASLVVRHLGATQAIHSGIDSILASDGYGPRQ
jgi:ATP-dependent Clp protease ATP-binding subunit ClpA